MKWINKLQFFYFLSFVEGGIMLITELASTRKIAVFFGSSLYVWLIVLSVTLIGLALGYYVSNGIVKKMQDNSLQDRTKWIALSFFVLSFWLLLWKWNTQLSLFIISMNIDLIPAVLIDALFLILIPMFIYGSLTTLIIATAQILSTKEMVYGKVLAHSTFGSVLLAVVAVLWAFPFIGVQWTMSIIALLSFCLALTIYKINLFYSIISLILFIVPEKTIRANVLYKNDGSFSSVMVIDGASVRYLVVNYIIQTFVDTSNHKTLPYAEVIDSIAQFQKWKNKDVLILGLGGGILANKMIERQCNVTGVEIDSRIIMCAKKFFHLSNKVKTFCEDAQWWIQKDTNKYDVIIMDVFNGEEPPSYLLTYENFLQLKNLLKDQNSLLIINWYGYYTSYLGKSTRILINTLHQAGFYTSFIPTDEVESHSNLVIFASANQTVLPTSTITIKPENEINTQDKNILSLLNANANYQWRKGYLKFIEYWWR